MENETVIANPSMSLKRYAITQEQIEDILKDELKDFAFPVSPEYNPRIRDNGRIVFEVKGTSKRLKRIEIGKQDSPHRKFLVDTLLHEYYEADIVANRLSSELYSKLDNALTIDRHKWINERIAEFFKKLEE